MGGRIVYKKHILNLYTNIHTPFSNKRGNVVHIASLSIHYLSIRLFYFYNTIMQFSICNYHIVIYTSS
jgi:hypothetical protein